MAAVTKEPVLAGKTAENKDVQSEEQPKAGRRPDSGKAGNYMVLLKPRVMSLVVFTALVGLMAAPPGGIAPLQAALAIVCIAVGAGASGALNMWYDADIDAVMKRTRSRPIPKGAVAPRQALLYGLLLAVLSVAALGFFVNALSAFLLAFTIFFYAVIYTVWLKRSTPQNIVIGGAAGAFPPVIGWAAATGEISLSSIVLFLIIFLWTPPHFWALSLFSHDDYETAQIPMMPNVRGELSTKRQIFVYSILMALAGVAPGWLGFGGWVYGICAAVLGLMFVEYARRLLVAPGRALMIQAARKLFFFSLMYLSLLFAILLTETVIRRLLEFYDRLA